MEKVNDSYDQLNVLGRAMAKVKWKNIEAFLSSNLYLRIDDFQSGYTISDKQGRIAIDPDIKNQVHQYLRNNQNLRFAFLALTYDNDVGIHQIDVDSPTPRPCARPYATLGSGEIADAELLNFFSYNFF